MSNIISEKDILDYLRKYSSKLGKPVPNPNIVKLKDTLEWLNHYDEYYAIINIGNNKVEWHYGIGKYLGYDDTDIRKHELLFFRNIIHPFVRDWHSVIMLGLFDLFSDNSKHNFNLLSTRFMINIPVRKKNGTYVFVKQMSLPIQFDNHDKIVSYLSAYVIVDEYKGQPLHPRVFEKNKQKKNLYKLLKECTKTHFNLHNNNFTRKQFIFLESFLKNFGYHEKWHDKIAADLMIKDPTIRTHLMKISDRIDDLFKIYNSTHPEANNSDNFISCMPRWNDLEGFILFLQQSGILSLLKIHYEKNAPPLPEFENF